MCGRYALELALEHPQYLAGVELAEPVRNYNVAPTHTVPILVDRPLPQESWDGQAGAGFERQIHAARWGLLPAWAQDPAFASRAFNARSETIFSKPTFREAALAGHCAIPVTGYYEWKTQSTLAGKTKKTPHLVRRADRRPLYLAGLYFWWKIPAEHAGAGSTFEGQAGSWLLTCSILTMDAPGHGEYPQVQNPREAELGDLHSRLPIPLGVADDRAVDAEDSLTRWLRSGKLEGPEAPAGAGKTWQRQDAEAALAELKAAAFAHTQDWEIYPVSNDVGRVSVNEPYLLEPAEDLLTGL